MSKLLRYCFPEDRPDRTLLSFILLYFLSFLLLAFIYPVVFAVVVCVVAFVIISEPLIYFIMRLKPISRVIAGVLTLLIFFAAILVLMFFLIPSLIQEAGNFYSFLVKFFETREWEQYFQDNPEIAQNITDVVRSIQPKVLELAQSGLDYITRITPTALTFLFYVVLGMVYLVFYLPSFKINVKYLFPNYCRDEAVVFLRDVYAQIRRFLFSIVIVGMIIGFIIGVMLALVGSRYYLLMGFWGFFTNLIPIVGVILEVIPLFILSFSLGLGTTLGIGVAILFLHTGAFILFLFLMKGYAKINPVATIFLILLFSQIFGLMGSLIAVPFGLTLKIFWQRFITPFFEKNRSILKEECVDSHPDGG